MKLKWDFKNRYSHIYKFNLSLYKILFTKKINGIGQQAWPILALSLQQSQGKYTLGKYNTYYIETRKKEGYNVVPHDSVWIKRFLAPLYSCTASNIWVLVLSPWSGLSHSNSPRSVIW